MDTATLDQLDQDQDQDQPALTPEQIIAHGGIPDGYVRDSVTKEIRPRKRSGRRRTGTAALRPDTPLDRSPDEKPDSKAKAKRQPATPRYQKGVIAAGMTRLYKRTGKIIKAMDKPIGIAVIESAEDCGEAWDELARTNPRVRRALMKLISGGAWGALIMAHAPIFLAILMKDGIRKHIPFMKLLNSVLDDQDESNDIKDLLGGMNADDMRDVMNLAQNLMGSAAASASKNGA